MQTALPSLDCLISCLFILIFLYGLYQLYAAALTIGKGSTEPLTQTHKLRQDTGVVCSQEYVVGISRSDGRCPV